MQSPAKSPTSMKNALLNALSSRVQIPTSVENLGIIGLCTHKQIWPTLPLKSSPCKRSKKKQQNWSTTSIKSHLESHTETVPEKSNLRMKSKLEQQRHPQNYPNTAQNRTRSMLSIPQSCPTLDWIPLHYLWSFHCSLFTVLVEISICLAQR